MGFWQPRHFLIPPPILFTINGALGTGFSGILFVLVTRIVSLIGSDENCTVLAAEVPLLCVVRVPVLHFFGAFRGHF